MTTIRIELTTQESGVLFYTSKHPMYHGWKTWKSIRKKLKEGGFEPTT